MADQNDDARIFALWAAMAPRVPPREPPREQNEEAQRARLMAAVEAEPYLPFCAELARHFDLALREMRALLARIVDPAAWTRGSAPVEAFFDFEPGRAMQPLRAGFVRLKGGTQLPRHRHTDRELTFILEGELVEARGSAREHDVEARPRARERRLDDGNRRYGPGAAIDMPVGSVHSLGVPDSTSTVVALLHGRIELFSD